MRISLLSALTIIGALLSASVSAQELSAPQMAAVKAAIVADPVLNAAPLTCCDAGSGAATIATAMNVSAEPAFIVWKTSVSIGEVGRAFNATELAGLSSLNHTRLQTLAIYLSNGVNPSLTAVRAFFDDIFSGTGGTNTPVPAASRRCSRRAPAAMRVQRRSASKAPFRPRPSTTRASRSKERPRWR